MRLTVYPPGFGQPSGSPFAVKAIALMQMSGLAYELDVNPDPRKSPKKKFPVLQDGDKVIPDSDHIREYLESSYGIDFEPGLDADQKAVARLIIRTLEESTYFGILATRWQNEANWPVTRDEFFQGMPPVIGGLITRAVRKGVVAQVMGQGMGRHSEPEMVARVAKEVDAVAQILGGKPFLFGDVPAAADATAVPMLRAQAFFPAR